VTRATRDGARGLGARVAAQAKVNLLLRVLARTPTGYHDIQTVFQRIALADTVTVRTNVFGHSLEMRGLDVEVPFEQNLAWHAAHKFARYAGWPEDFAIEIEKRIPVGGGLGGGSADAAAVLRCLNALAPRSHAQSADTLASLALHLGADVPYLTTEIPTAVGSGRGQYLRAAAPLPPRHIVLGVPGFGVATAAAFSWYAASVAGRPEPAPASPLLPAPTSWEDLVPSAQNDLEGPVFAKHPELEMIRGALERHGAFIARMTGSGSTLFGVFDANAGDAFPASLTVGETDVRWIPTTTVEHVAPVELL
jgi:4-diphosphocytidyl-2-C-methyl-D-erythritol kinase